MNTPIKSILSSAVALCVLAAPAYSKTWVESASAEDRVATSVLRDDTVILRTDTAFKEVRVANPDIADVLILSDKSFHIMGKDGGKTNIMLYDQEERLVEIIDVSVDFDLRGLKRSLHETMPNEAIEVRPMAGGIYVSGTVSSQNTADRAIAIAQAYAPQNVTNGLTIRDSHQVMLEVRFVEASRDAVKELGIGMLTQRPGDFQFQSGTGLISGNAPSLSGVLLGGSGAVSLDTSIQALEDQGVIRTLAEPNLVSMSGDTASFLAGGEFPIPVAADDGQITIEFRQFGVGLSFTPTVRGDGVINLEVSPEVSQIDPSNSVRLSGIEIPSLRVRRANTTIELRNSQSFAIAGLLQNYKTATKSQVPWLGDVPVLGSLFRSTRYQNFETELVIIVTPRLVQPVPDISYLSTPLDGTSLTDEGDLFLNGTLETPTMIAPKPAKAQTPKLEDKRLVAGKLAGQYGHAVQ